MKDETGGFAIEEFVELKPKMHSFLVDDNSQNKKAKDVNRNVVEKDVLLNNKFLRHSIHRIQIKDHRMRTYEINKILLFCFDDKICIQNNGYDGLALGYQS